MKRLGAPAATDAPRAPSRLFMQESQAQNIMLPPPRKTTAKSRKSPASAAAAAPSPLRTQWRVRVRSANAQVKFVRNRRAFIDTETNKPLTGITKPLRESFFPLYNHWETEKYSGPKRARGPKGFKRGKRVDREVALYANRGVATKHTYAKRLIKALESVGLKPVAAQVSVADASTGHATAVDLLCERGGRIVIVEVKVSGCSAVGVQGPFRAQRSVSARPCSLSFAGRVG